MSTTSQSQLARVLRKLLQGEKESTRVWLRTEMDRYVCPLVDSIFARLTKKMAINTDWERIQSGDASNGALGENQMDLVKREIKEENEMELDNVMDNTPKANEQIGDCVKQEIKEEFEDGEMLDIKKEEEEDETNEVDLDEGGETDDDSNELSNQNLTNLADQEEGQVNNNIQHQFGEINNIGEMIDEVENGDGETQVNDIEAANQGDGDESRRMENPSMDTTLPHITEHSQDNTNKSARPPKRKHEVPQAQVRNEVTNQDVEDENEDDAGEGTSRKRPRPSTSTTSSTEQKQIITISLRCPQVDCPDIITKVHEFNAHMWEKHSIRQFRCLVKDCKQSFDKRNNLSEHLAQSHQHITQWNCDKCDHHFSTYILLSYHNRDYHLLGNFECSFLACRFTGEYKRKVYDHYNYRHKHTFTCDHPGCSYRTTRASDLKAHRRLHLNMKPYRCKWLQCDYASTRRDATIRHIRQVHFTRNPSSVPNGA